MNRGKEFGLEPLETIQWGKERQKNGRDYLEGWRRFMEIRKRGF